MRADSDRIADMLDAIAAIERRKPSSKEAFDADEMVQVWMLRHIQIISEPAAGVARVTRSRAPDIPWGKLSVCTMHWYMPTSISTGMPSGLS